MNSDDVKQFLSSSWRKVIVGLVTLLFLIAVLCGYMVTVLQTVGLIIVMYFLCFAASRLLKHKSEKTIGGWVTPCFIAAFIGLVLIFSEGLSEFTTPFASIKMATEKKGDALIAKVKEELDKKVAEVKDELDKKVEAIEVKRKEADKKVNEIDNKSQELDKKLKDIDKATEQANKAVADLKRYTEFNTAVVMADNDDRKSFDRLEAWANDKEYPFSGFAYEVWMSIVDSHSWPQMQTGFKVDWMPGTDPAKTSLEDLQELYKKAALVPVQAIQARLGLVEYIWNRHDIPKRQRMQFLIHVMRTDSSLKVVEYAGRYFMGDENDKWKPLAVEKHIEWWEKNKDTIK